MVHKRQLESSCMVIAPTDGDWPQQKKRKSLGRRCSDYISFFPSPSVFQPTTFQFEPPCFYLQLSYRNSFFDTFPRELFALILSKLPRSSICTAFRVCKAWSKQANNEYLWKLLYDRDVEPITFNSISWKELYSKWLLSDGLSIMLSSSKAVVRPGDSVSFEISVLNSKTHSINIVMGHSCFGIAFENGCLFNLTCNLDSNPLEITPIAEQMSTLSSTGQFYLATVPASGKITFSTTATCTTVNNNLCYVFSQGSIPGIRHALTLPASSHRLYLRFQRPSVVLNTNNTCFLFNPSSSSAQLWSGSATSNSIELLCLK